MKLACDCGAPINSGHPAWCARIRSVRPALAHGELFTRYHEFWHNLRDMTRDSRTRIAHAWMSWTFMERWEPQ